MKNNNPEISVVVPCYKCEQSLEELYRRLVDTLEKIVPSFEIILVNDASPENDWSVIYNLVSRDKKVIGINLSRNFGQHYAITAGLDYSSGNWVVVMDGDLQDQPEEIEKMYNKALEGYDSVLGQRTIRHDSYLKKVSSFIFYKTLSFLTETKQDEKIANFGIYSRKVINSICSLNDSIRYFPVMVQYVGFKRVSIDVKHSSRQHGKTSYTFRKLLKLALDSFLSFTDKPLKIIVSMGISISFLSFIYVFYIVLRYYIYKTPVEGWSSLIASVWLLSGLIIMTLGVVGIYVGKIFEQVKKRPLYIVKERLND
ncbi:MAG: glycosyltransferase [Candidatus Cloacimonadota bacterium]|nr:MAG: glycosyltransferase [Candidatus Cloacimonadota bacterium]PIE81365.1 MAG: glycosyltransferase [Candidatus Delongbacteria bacterium]